ERLEAALALVVLDRVADAVPVLLAAAAADPHLVGRASRALAWVPWEMRVELFDKFRALKTDEDGTEALVRWFSEVSEPRAVAPLGLRREAFQVMLRGQGAEDATGSAVAGVSHPDPAVRRIAAVYLSLGPNNLRQLRDRHIYLSVSVPGRVTMSGKTPKEQY